MVHHSLGDVEAKKIGRGRLKQRKHNQLNWVCFTTNTLGFLVWLFKKKVNLDWSKISAVLTKCFRNF